jgi:hypothetical protein
MKRIAVCVMWAACSAVAMGACGSDETSGTESAAVGDDCPQSGEFACGADSSGVDTGELLLCEGGTYILAVTCGDPEGCFIEDSAQQGRCFHGDGTGQVCRYVDGDPSCCTFTEPTLEC